MKICSRCYILKDFNEFYKHNKTKDKIQSHCKKCHLSICKDYNFRFPEKSKQRQKKYRDKLRMRIQINPKKIKKKLGRKPYLTIEEKRLKNIERCKNWRKKNPKRVRYYRAKWRTDVLNRTPKWADLEAIKRFYENCPPGYHVDHIIPLRGKTVSGFHVLENLQYLPAKENLKKNNKLLI